MARGWSGSVRRKISDASDASAIFGVQIAQAGEGLEAALLHCRIRRSHMARLEATQRREDHLTRALGGEGILAREDRAVVVAIWILVMRVRSWEEAPHAAQAPVLHIFVLGVSFESLAHGCGGASAVSTFHVPIGAVAEVKHRPETAMSLHTKRTTSDCRFAAKVRTERENVKGAGAAHILKTYHNGTIRAVHAQCSHYK